MNFSVLTSVYYKERSTNLELALESIWDNQSIKPNEIVLVKDGPLGDELECVIEEFRQIAPLKVIGLKENLGLGKALNIGLAECSYDIVARMDTDDIAFPNRFEEQVDFMKNNPEVDLLGTWVDEFENDIDNVISHRRVPANHKDILTFMKKRNPFNHPSVMYRKSMVLAAGGYLDFHLNEDYYLWARMAAKGAKFHNTSKSLLFFRTGTEMFKRRGGWRYAVQDYKLQKEFKKLGIINSFEFISNTSMRCVARLIPNSVRGFIYRKILRN